MNKQLVLISIVLLLNPFVVYGAKPTISGNVEQGSRYAVPYDDLDVFPLVTEFTEEFEQESWAYNYRKGYLQVTQTLNPKFRYSARVNWDAKEFPWQDLALNNKNTVVYYRTYCWITFSKALALRLEYYLREQKYDTRPWDNLTYVPNLQLKWDIDPSRKRRANLFVRLNSRRFDDEGEVWKDRDQVSARINYQEEVFGRLLLKAQYSYVFRRYTDNPDRANAEKKAISAGFEYKF